MSIHQQEQNLLCSPSATGKDFNQLMPIVKVIEKSASIKIRLDGNKPTETASTLPREAPRNSDFQGSASSSSSKVYQNIAQDSGMFLVDTSILVQFPFSNCGIVFYIWHLPGDLRTVEAEALRINSWGICDFH